jgi:hypothetical protein
MTALESAGHYVYLYRDERGRPRYVGYGERPTRATAHLIASHNLGLADFVLHGTFTIEVAGPFGTEEVGRTVETALISALKPDLNVVPGSSAARFRPLGMPVEYADRLSQPSLRREDFILAQGASPAPVLFVHASARDFGDGRVGYDPAHPPTDDQVLERVAKWWQLEALVPAWIAAPAESPGLLVGIHGPPGSQIVIASLTIDRAAWSTAQLFERGEGKIRVPLKPTGKLDAFGLRGRWIQRAADLAFEGVPAGFFIVLNPDGSSSGGRRARRAKPRETSS